MTNNKFCYDTLELKMHDLYKLIRSISGSGSTILLTGASGTGKEAICHLIHEQSPRANDPYLVIDCASIPKELLESELFGHEAGAFSDAHQSKPGKFEVAGNGTLVLDEITECDMKTQAKLLRVIEAREFYRIGANTPTRLHARIIATTNRDLPAQINKNLFRQDLYFRLNVMRIELPKLCERQKDIPLFVDFFMNDLAGENNQTKQISPEVYHALCCLPWEGNTRELKNFVTRMYYLASENLITINDIGGLSTELRGWNRQFVVPHHCTLSLYELEKQFILHTMQQMKGNKSRTALALKISLKTLRNKLKEYGERPLYSMC